MPEGRRIRGPGKPREFQHVPVRTPFRALPQAAAALAALTLPAAAATPYRKMPTESGRLTCRVSAGDVRGIATLSWRDWGASLRQDLTGTANSRGKFRKVTQWAVATDGHLFVHDQRGKKSVLRGPLRAPLNGVPPPGLMLLGPPRDAGTVIGKATILGRTCEIRQLGPGKAWYWNGLPLRMEIRQANGSLSRSVAMKLDLDRSPATSEFRVPSGYRIENYQPKPGPNGPGGPGGPGGPALPGG